MTLIAGFDVGGFPCLIGDVVLSDSTRPEIPVPLPTAGDSSLVEQSDSDWFITDLQQKVVVISADLAIAWSGSSVMASIVVEELRELAETSDDLTNDFELYAINFIDYEDSADLSFIGWIHEESRITIFSHGVATQQTSSIGEVKIGGSGDETLAAIIRHRDQEFKTPNSDTHPSIHAMNVCHAFVESLLSAEYENGESLSQYFGGAYEICVWHSDRFIKLHPRSFLVTEMRLAENGWSQDTLKLYLRFDYIGDLLRVQVVNHNISPSRREVQLIRPIGKNKDDYNNNDLAEIVTSLPSAERTWLTAVIYARFRDEDKIGVHAAHTHFIDVGTGEIQLQGDIRSLQVLYSEWIIQYIRGKLSEQVARSYMQMPLTKYVTSFRRQQRDE